MIKNNFLKDKLESGKAVVGTWSIIPSVIVTDIIASSGVDFIIIDSEHGPINFETAQNINIACESHSVSPVMRVGGIIEQDILKALDIGVHCVQIPNISNLRDLKNVVNLVKYPPIGNRGFSPFTRAGNYSIDNAKNLTSIANKNVLLAIHVEGKKALKNIDQILSLKNLDIIFIGIFDISKSLGIPGDVENYRVKNILKDFTKKINYSGKYPGTIVNNSKQLEEAIDYGVKYITYSVDCNILSKSYKDIVTNFNSIHSR